MKLGKAKTDRYSDFYDILHWVASKSKILSAHLSTAHRCQGETYFGDRQSDKMLPLSENGCIKTGLCATKKLKGDVDVPD